MNNPFIAIHSTGGRIGRFCWVNSDLREDPRSVLLARWRDGEQALIPGGSWGVTFFCSPHPARPAEAW